MNLSLAIKELYTTFSQYKLYGKIDGCPCCINRMDKVPLHTKQLNKLTNEDLSFYAFKAMTTIGNVGDFKYFLPRIFELMSTSEFGVDNFVLLGKLKYGHWENWKEQERNSIKQMLMSWWNVLNQNQHYGPGFIDDFSEIYKFNGDLDGMLNSWDLTSKVQSIYSLSLLINNIKPILKGTKQEYKHFNENDIKFLKNWISDKIEILEKGYNELVINEPESSWEIANAINFVKFEISSE